MATRSLLVLLVCFATQAVAQRPAAPAKDKEIEWAQSAAMRAVNFHQGDAQALKRAQPDFTPAAWSDYMKTLQGFLDASGQPSFSSSFVPSGKPVVTGPDKEGFHLRIPGTLVQTKGISRTTYGHCEIDVTAGGIPLRIMHLETVLRIATH